MEKIQLNIINISHGVAQSNNFAVILGELDGERHLPIIIGGNEAQAIAVALEGMISSRPLTHDLFKNTFSALNIELKEVLINKLQDGIFYAKLVCITNGDYYEIDSRSSDAIAIAVRFQCPIYTNEAVLNEAGIIMPEKEKKAKPKKPKTKVKLLTNYSLDELNQMLSKTIETEDYEKAAKIRDELSRRTKES